MDEGVEVLTPTQEKSLTSTKTEAREKETREARGIPEIVVQPEKGVYLLSLALKGRNLDWGNHTHELAKLTEQYFRQHILKEEVKNAIETLEEEGIDEETLYYLSLTYQRPERTEGVFTILRKHKDVQGLEKLQQRLLDVLSILDTDLDSDPSFTELRDKFAKETRRDIKKRQGQLKESQQSIEELMDFFRPKLETIPLKRINLMPTNFLYQERSGKSFMLGEELVLMSPIGDSLDGQTHEFLHSVVNPIIDKLDKILIEDQKQKITQMASGKLRQHYGEEYYSLLSEEFIRTYVNIFAKGEKPPTYEDFQDNLRRVTTEEQFQEILAEDEELRRRLDTLSISDLRGLIGRSKDYFERYEQDPLQDMVYGFYQDYKEESSNYPGLTFEDFVLQGFRKQVERMKSPR